MRNYFLWPKLLLSGLCILLAMPLFAQPESVVLGAGELESRPVTPATYDDYYTVQIGAFSAHEQAVDFAKKLQLPAEQMGVARILVNDNILFVLAYGMYPDKEQARKEAEKVCGEKKLKGCWARSLGGVRELSKAAKERDESIE